ncbi:DnaA N-terminal domain-containing protein [Bacillus swezeyi]|uniref:DnaA N-terminal domain-containing protein n=1 Tax=Bacillus swezeyi TaxID=1925020 RepID=A0A5M8RHL8_9BACI|nr:DnaA N-terminal domain-containing protein [Bacillus swezeyi]KAA6446938.1 hypothetical protein DX927_23085 [Bacillus swezeyi]KAA6471506.1 hypothetical protein DX928_23325 [Bacillus swezeyi]
MEESNLSSRNLKDNEDELLYYRNVETGQKIARKRTKKMQNEIVSEIYYVPEYEKRVFNEDYVKEFSLDKFGEAIPYVDGEITILNNYFYDFWGYFLKAEGTSLYGHLKRYAYGTKDWCWPNIELISLKMDKSQNTIRNLLDLLERYGFIYKFNVTNKSRENVEESPVYKIRKQVPLLTQKLIEGDPSLSIGTDDPPHIKKAKKKEQTGLPERLKTEHKKFVNKMLDQSKNVNILDAMEYELIYSDILSKGAIQKLYSDKHQKIKETTHPKTVTMSEKESNLTDSVKEILKSRLSKPSFETWFSSFYIKLHDNLCVILVTDEFYRDWIHSRYLKVLLEILHELGEDIQNIDVRVIQ